MDEHKWCIERAKLLEKQGQNLKDGWRALIEKNSEERTLYGSLLHPQKLERKVLMQMGDWGDQKPIKARADTGGRIRVGTIKRGHATEARSSLVPARSTGHPSAKPLRHMIS